MLKENQIEDLHLYLNMTCDVINVVFNKMEETFQSNTLDWSSLVLYFSSLFSTSVSFHNFVIFQPIGFKFLGYDQYD